MKLLIETEWTEWASSWAGSALTCA